MTDQCHVALRPRRQPLPQALGAAQERACARGQGGRHSAEQRCEPPREAAAGGAQCVPKGRHGPAKATHPAARARQSGRVTPRPPPPRGVGPRPPPRRATTALHTARNGSQRRRGRSRPPAAPAAGPRLTTGTAAPPPAAAPGAARCGGGGGGGGRAGQGRLGAGLLGACCAGRGARLGRARFESQATLCSPHLWSPNMICAVCSARLSGLLTTSSGGGARRRAAAAAAAAWAWPSAVSRVSGRPGSLKRGSP